MLSVPVTATATRWSVCVVCGDDFTQPRRPGRPAVTCSAECRQARGKNGGLRKDRGSAGTGFVALDHSIRDGGESRAAGMVADLLGEPDNDARGAVVVFEPHRTKPGATWDHQREEWAREGRRERRRAAREGWGDYADALPTGPAGVGRTCPHILDRHVIGSPEPWGWAEEWESRGSCPWPDQGTGAKPIVR